jgi:hypothetical protein
VTDFFFIHKLIGASIEPSNNGDVLLLVFAPPNLAPFREFHFHVGRGGARGIQIDPAILPTDCVALPDAALARVQSNLQGDE